MLNEFIYQYFMIINVSNDDFPLYQMMISFDVQLTARSSMSKMSVEPPGIPWTERLP